MAEVVNSPVQNESKSHVSHQHSHFPIVFDSFDTHQFGYIRPHLCILGISSDSFKHRPVVKSRSLNLKAPLMQDVYRKLSYFKVNLDAVLPFNAEKIYTNPVIGSDVPSDANCVLSNGFKFIADSVEAAISSNLSAYIAVPNGARMASFIKSLIFGELFYSRGSLLASLGAHLYSQFQCYFASSPKVYDFDYYFDTLMGTILTKIGSSATSSVLVTIDGVSYKILAAYDLNDSLHENDVISFRDFICMIRETSDWSFGSDGDSVFDSNIFTTPFTRYYSYSPDAPFNIQRVLSYQLACAEFFTNDKVDYIYSAELFRQYIGDLLRSSIVGIVGDSSWPQNFTYNGINYQYDYLSGQYLYMMLNYIIYYPFYSNSLSSVNVLQYFLSIFGLKRSLRYKDYFAGSRTSPLAVGDVNVNVNSNLVNVVDVTRKIQLQRFLNVVNHTGRRLSNYVKTLFGVDIKPDRHVPNWLADLTENVYTSEVENTGADQLTKGQTITAIFTSNSSNKELDFGIDLYSCIIGVTTYDIERAFTNTIDRDFFIKDRFDMFVPELQFVGDQPIYAQEISASDQSSFGTAFGYQFRDMQWKLMYSRASGGFVGNLPGFAFINRPMPYQGNKISPDFIRCFPTEFDNFFVSLSGYSLGNYWHFIVWTKNVIEADRPMIANPVILE